MNGYSESILQYGEYCWLCGNTAGKLDRHEAFGGPFRQKSKRLGLWILLCHDSCHIFGPFAAHQNTGTARKIKRAAQTAAMEKFGWSTDDFIREFGKNYLGE